MPRTKDSKKNTKSKRTPGCRAAFDKTKHQNSSYEVFKAGWEAAKAHSAEETMRWLNEGFAKADKLFDGLPADRKPNCVGLRV